MPAPLIPAGAAQCELQRHVCAWAWASDSPRGSAATALRTGRSGLGGPSLLASAPMSKKGFANRFEGPPPLAGSADGPRSAHRSDPAGPSLLADRLRALHWPQGSPLGPELGTGRRLWMSTTTRPTRHQRAGLVEDPRLASTGCDRLLSRHRRPRGCWPAPNTSRPRPTPAAIHTWSCPFSPNDRERLEPWSCPRFARRSRPGSTCVMTATCNCRHWNPSRPATFQGSARSAAAQDLGFRWCLLVTDAW